jgi:branched-chain amino acid transport system substrate-binding protein
MNWLHRALLVFVVFSALLSGWFAKMVHETSVAHAGRRGLAQARAARAAAGRGDVHIGVVGSWSRRTGLLRGIQLAARTINAAGGVLGRPLVLHVRDDEMNSDVALRVAEEFSRNLELAAVIGNTYSETLAATGVMYEYAGLLAMTPIATLPDFSRQEFRLVFRNVPNARHTSDEIVRFLKRQGYRRVILYHVDDLFGSSMANAIEQAAQRAGVNVVDHRQHAYDGSDNLIVEDLQQCKSIFAFDALIVVDHIASGARIIRAAREIHLDQPILAVQGFDSEMFLNLARDYDPGVLFTVSCYGENDRNPAARQFREAYRAAYRHEPSHYSAQGYDTVFLLKYAMESAGTVEPRKVADALRKIDDWAGAAGPHAFHGGTDVTKPLYFKRMTQGKFVTISDATLNAETACQRTR